MDFNKMNANSFSKYICKMKNKEINNFVNCNEYPYLKALSDLLMYSKKDRSYNKLWKCIEEHQQKKLEELENDEITIDEFTAYELFDYYRPQLQDLIEEYGDKYKHAIELINDKIKELNRNTMINEISEIMYELHFIKDDIDKLLKRFNYNLYDIYIFLKKDELYEGEVYEIWKGEYTYFPSEYKYPPNQKLTVGYLSNKMLELHGNTIMIKDDYYSDYEISDELIDDRLLKLDDDMDSSHFIKVYKKIYN